MMRATLLLLCLALGVPAARADETARAEHTRLQQEMRQLASRQAWKGVNNLYNAMLNLSAQGVMLTYEDHLLAAQAARGLGHIDDSRQRLERARVLQATPEVLNWLSEIDRSYAPVQLRCESSMVGEVELGVEELPFATDQRLAIEYAQGLVQKSGSYSGLLPVGRYTYGSEKLAVVAGEPAVTLQLQPAPEAPREPRDTRLSPLVDLGPWWGGAGAAETPDGETAGVQGLGLRAGGGLHLALSPRMGLFAHGSWQALRTEAEPDAFSEEDWSAASGAATAPATTQYKAAAIWLGPSVQAGPLNLLAGPSLGLLRAAGGQGIGDDAEAPFEASPRAMGGAAASAAWTFHSTPVGGPALALSAGAHHDGGALHPWAQLGLAWRPASAGER
jgi:hypothetical protein